MILHLKHGHSQFVTLLMAAQESVRCNMVRLFWGLCWGGGGWWSRTLSVPHEPYSVHCTLLLGTDSVTLWPFVPSRGHGSRLWDSQKPPFRAQHHTGQL